MRHCLAIFLGPVAVVVCSSGLAAQEVAATRTSEPIEIDGVLDEADWGSAAGIDAFTQLQPVAGAAASQRTVIRVLYDERMVYFGIDSRDTDPGVISRTVTQRDGEVWDVPADGGSVRENMNRVGFIRDDDRREVDSNLRRQFWINRYGL